MGRRLFTAASVISLLLCAVTAVLWVRSGTHTDAWDLRTKGGTHWQFFSTSCLGIEHVSDWPADTRILYAGYLNNDVQSLKPRSLVLLATGGVPGAYTHDFTVLHAFIASGMIRTLVQPDGAVLRVPPYPHDWVNYLSSPMPYWSIGIPHWMAFVLFAIPPASLSMQRPQKPGRF